MILLAGAAVAKAQHIDSIYFHLYTDSLKKGQHNYINVDGKMSNGTWMPLTEKEIQFSCATASFTGNELVIPEDFKHKYVKVKAVLKANPSIWKEVTIWIKQAPDPPLPSRHDMLPKSKKRGRRG